MKSRLIVGVVSVILISSLLLSSGAALLVIVGADSSGNSSSLASEAVGLAESVVGAPYLWGGKGWDWDNGCFVDSSAILNGYHWSWADPNAVGQGVDCSGLVFWAFNKADGATSFTGADNPIPGGAPHYAEGAQGQWTGGYIEQISTSIPTATDLEPGYLLFLDTSQNGDMDHVMMYVGDGWVIHAEGVLFNRVEKETLTTVLTRYQQCFGGYGRVKAADEVVDETATIQVDSNPANARFRLSGPASYSSVTPWSKTDASVGTYTIAWSWVGGRLAPEDETHILDADESISFYGDYANAPDKPHTEMHPYCKDFDVRVLLGFEDQETITAGDIEAYIEEWYPNSPMLAEANIGSVIINAGTDNQINPAFLVASAELEGRFGTAGWAFSYPEAHNTMGWGVPASDTPPDSVNSADSWGEMAERVADRIAHGAFYYAQDRYTVEEIRDIYSAADDAEIVARLMNQLYWFAEGREPITVHLSSVDASRFPDIYVYASVRDLAGDLITGLTKDHFVLTEQSELEEQAVEQVISVSTVEEVMDNVALVLTIDRSGSMSGTPMANAKEAAKTLVDTLKVDDRCAVVSFATDVRLDHGFVGADEGGKISLKNAIDGLSATGWTALYRAIYESVEHLSGEVGIPAVIVLTDGKNENQPPYDPDAAIALAHDKGVPVYTIGLGNVDEGVLRRIADETGGSYHYTPNSEELKDIYLEIAASIQAQYLLAYRTHNRDFDGTVRTVEVTANYNGQIDSDTITYRVAEPPQISLTTDTKEIIAAQQPGAVALTISAEITSNIGIDSAQLFYRTSGSGESYIGVYMSGNGSIYSADVPGDEVTDPGVEFYITASDRIVTSSSPKTKPAEFPYQIAVQPNEKPIIVHDPVETASPGTDIVVEAEVTDEAPYGPIEEVVLFYRPSDEVLYERELMERSGVTYNATIPASAVTLAGIDYYIVAVDVYGVRAYEGAADQPHHVSVELTQTKRVAYIPIEFPDQRARLSIGQLRDRAGKVAEYFDQQSYGRVVIETEFILDQYNRHISLERRYRDYNSYAGKTEAAQEMYDRLELRKLEREKEELYDGQFLEFLDTWSKEFPYFLRSLLITVDALEETGFEVGVDFRMDIDVDTGRVGLVFEDYDSVVLIQHPRVYEKWSLAGKHTTRGFAWFEWAYTSEQEGLSVWAHELGHTLFGWLDFGGDAGDSGSVGYWCLMGEGASTNPPPMVMSFNKVSAGWLDYSRAWVVQEIQLLHELDAGDYVYTYSPFADEVDYFVFEGRHPGVEQAVTDPIHGIKEELRSDRGIMIYKVQGGEVWQLWPQLKPHEYLRHFWPPARDPENRVTLLPNDTHTYEYKDLPSETRFTAWEENSTLYLSIDPFMLTDYSYICLGEVSITYEGSATALPLAWMDSEYPFDVGLQVYTEDGRMVGPDYEASEYRMEIADALSSGPILGGGPEWIAVPSDERVYFAIDPTPAQKWAQKLGINPITIEVELKAGCFDSEGERTEVDPVTVMVGLDTPLYFVVEDGEIKLLLEEAPPAAPSPAPRFTPSPPSPSVEYDLVVSSTVGGSVSDPGEGSFTYDEGTVVNLVAEAQEGYQFVRWTGDIDDIDNPDAASTTITMDSNYSITAEFEETAAPPPTSDRHQLIISSTTGGSVTTPGEGAFAYDEGTTVKLVAEAEEGHRFVNWTGDVDAIGNVNAATTSVMMEGDYTIEAEFERDQSPAARPASSPGNWQLPVALIGVLLVVGVVLIFFLGRKWKLI